MFNTFSNNFRPSLKLAKIPNTAADMMVMIAAIKEALCT